MAKATTFGESNLGYDMSLWYDSKPLKIGWFAMLAAVGSGTTRARTACM